METKDTNPKDGVGIKKVPFHVVPTQVIGEIGLGMMEGDLKYGGHNYRVAGVRASVYYDALQRHISAWWEGEDIDKPSQLSHVTKSLSTLAVLRDSMLNDMMTDDRPPKVKNQNWIEDYNKHAAKLIEANPNPAKPYIELDKNGGPQNGSD